jgi:hypothetical protein
VVKRVLEDRKMSFGPGFLAWMERADAIQRSLFAGRGGVPRVSVQLRGVPASVSGAPGLRVKRRDLRLSCPDGEQTFVYREGGGSETFNWTASCQSLALRIVLGGETEKSDVSGPALWHCQSSCSRRSRWAVEYCNGASTDQKGSPYRRSTGS